MCRNIILLLIAMTGVPNQTVAADGLRTWKDSTGQFSIEAELVDFNDGIVQLKRLDGRVIRVPLKRLSQADQKYVQGYTTKKAPPAASPEEAVAQLIAAAKRDDASAFVALLPVRYVESYGRLNALIVERKKVEAGLCKLLRERFGDEGDELAISMEMDWQGPNVWKHIESIQITEKKRDGEKLLLTTTTTVKIPTTGEQIETPQTLVAEKEDGGWKLVWQEFAELGPKGIAAFAAREQKYLERMKGVPARIESGDLKSAEDVTLALLGM